MTLYPETRHCHSRDEKNSAQKEQHLLYFYFIENVMEMKNIFEEKCRSVVSLDVYGKCISLW